MAAGLSMRAIVFGALLAGALAPWASHAQSTAAATAAVPPLGPAAPPPTGPPSATAVGPAMAEPPPPPSPQIDAAIDRRIAALRLQLGITPAQMPLWTAFAQAMRQNALSNDALFAQRAGAVATMNAIDNMHDYARIARAYADNTESLAAAFDSLYESLSETQK